MTICNAIGLDPLEGQYSKALSQYPTGMAPHVNRASCSALCLVDCRLPSFVRLGASYRELMGKQALLYCHRCCCLFAHFFLISCALFASLPVTLFGLFQISESVMNRGIWLALIFAFAPFGVQANPHGMETAEHRQARLQHMTEQLNLTEEQQQEVSALWDRQHEQVAEIHAATQAGMQEILSAEQFAKLNSCKQRERHGHGHGHGHGHHAKSAE